MPDIPVRTRLIQGVYIRNKDAAQLNLKPRIFVRYTPDGFYTADGTPIKRVTIERFYNFERLARNPALR